MSSRAAVLMLCLAGRALGAEPGAEEIVRRADRAVLGENAAYKLRMTVVRAGRGDRVVELDGWKKGDEKGLVRYTSPARERGTAYLRNADSTWLYLPSGEKVVRVGPKQSFGGGDFTNGDIFRLSLILDYLPTLAGQEDEGGLPCYRLELKARDRKVAYDRVVYWVRRDGSFFPVRADYHTLAGKRLKTLRLSAVARLGGRERPTELTMESAVEEGSRTVLRFLEIDDAARIDDRVFAPSSLERGF